MALCFAADRTLGKLAKWLRILGFDTLFESDSSDKWFFEHLKEERILLTRTGRIRKQCAVHRLVFITSNYLNEQLKQVIVETGIISPDVRPFSRCIHCNVRIVDIDQDDVYGLVPDYIFETSNEFHKCRQCNRIYWPGSHTKRSMQRIEHLFMMIATENPIKKNVTKSDSSRDHGSDL